MKTILLCLTGGTLGSVIGPDGIRPDRQTAGALLTGLSQRHPQRAASVAFETIQPLNLLSENLLPRHWGELVATLNDQDLTRHAGIIVGHGTDTLPYTAAALHYCFQGLPIPILLVSSNRPLSEPDANGFDHFAAAVDFILDVAKPGVYVPYRNLGQSLALHQATRLLSSLPLSSDFISAGGAPLAWHEQGRFRFTAPLEPDTRDNLSLPALFSSRILMIRPYPGLDYRGIGLTGYRAVLHDLYHSGTACIDNEPGAAHALPDFIEHCQALNIPVYLAPIANDQPPYQTSRAIAGVGGQFLPGLTLEAAYAKLCLAYGVFTDPDDIAAFLSQDLGT